MPTGPVMHVVIGSDRDVPLGRVVYAEPRPKPTGLAWPNRPASEPTTRPPVAATRATAECCDCGTTIGSRSLRCQHCNAAHSRSLIVRGQSRRGHRRGEPSRGKPGPHTGRAAYVDARYARLTELDATCAQVRDWADRNGIPVNPRGLVRLDVIEAYAKDRT